MIDKDIEGCIGFNSHEIDFVCEISDILVYLDFFQVFAMNSIFSSLSPTNLLESSCSELENAIKMIENKVDLSVSLKTYKIDLKINKIDLILSQNPCEFEKV